MAAAKVFYFNGPILTMNEGSSVAEALLTEGERIKAVGSPADVELHLGADTERVNLAGKCLMPAFIDPHGHFPDPGLIRLFRVSLAPPPLGDCADMAEALQRLKSRCDQTPPGKWIMGVQFDNSAIAERRMPTRMELDQVSGDLPVWVIHASGHNGVANSRALSEMNIEEQATDPPNGRFGRDPKTGLLDGRIEGIAAMGPLGDTDFLINADDFRAGFNDCRDEYLAHGVTLAQNSWATQRLLTNFAAIAADGDPGIDLVILPAAELEPDLSYGSMKWPDQAHVTLGPRKLFSDGAFPRQTALLSEPYFKVTNPDAPCGVPHMPQSEMDDQVRRLHDMGFQIHCHCNGDGGADIFLSAIEKVLLENPRDDHRHTIIHGQTLRDDQLERMAKLGVTVSFFSAHIYFWGDRHLDTFLGPERAARISPAASAENYGVRYTLHNDASVTPTRPLHLAHCAVERLTATGRLLGADQKIPVLSALRAQTIDAAWQVFQEAERGSLEPDKLADMVILSQNPLRKGVNLQDVTVCETIRNGIAVYKS